MSDERTNPDTVEQSDGVSSAATFCAALASRILDLVSLRYPATAGQPEQREGFDTLIEKVDEEATEIIEKALRGAYWKKFHKAGELWFDNLGTEEECEAITEQNWRDFAEGIEITADDA